MKSLNQFFLNIRSNLQIKIRYQDTENGIKVNTGGSNTGMNAVTLDENSKSCRWKTKNLRHVVSSASVTSAAAILPSMEGNAT